MHFAAEWADGGSEGYSPWYHVEGVRRRSIQIAHAGTPDGTITVWGANGSVHTPPPANGAGVIITSVAAANALRDIDTPYCLWVQFQRTTAGVAATVRFNGIKSQVD